MVGEKECKKIKILYDAKCWDAIAKVVGRCFLRKKKYPQFCWESHACQGHSTNPKQPKETPHNNHLRDLPPTSEYSPIPMPLFLHRFFMNSQFLNGYPRPRNW